VVLEGLVSVVLALLAVQGRAGPKSVLAKWAGPGEGRRDRVGRRPLSAKGRNRDENQNQVEKPAGQARLIGRWNNLILDTNVLIWERSIMPLNLQSGLWNIPCSFILVSS
jgi:hypothetical protein